MESVDILGLDIEGWMHILKHVAFYKSLMQLNIVILIIQLYTVNNIWFVCNSVWHN